MEQQDRRVLSLKLTPQGASWCLRVQDSGPGLNSAALERLFTPFNTEKADGLGLGLTLSQTLAQGMNGDLFGENVFDEGACFTLTLPVAKEVYVPVS